MDFLWYQWKQNSLELHATRQVNFTDHGLQDFRHTRVYLFVQKFKIWEAEYLIKDALMG